MLPPFCNQIAAYPSGCWNITNLTPIMLFPVRAKADCPLSFVNKVGIICHSINQLTVMTWLCSYFQIGRNIFYQHLIITPRLRTNPWFPAGLRNIGLPFLRVCVFPGSPRDLLCFFFRILIFLVFFGHIHLILILYLNRDVIFCLLPTREHKRKQILSNIPMIKMRLILLILSALRKAPLALLPFFFYN